MKTALVLIIGACYTAGLFSFETAHYIRAIILFGVAIAISILCRWLEDEVLNPTSGKLEDDYE